MLSSTWTAPHVPQYGGSVPSHSSYVSEDAGLELNSSSTPRKPLNPTAENNALLARLPSATPSTFRGVRPAVSFRISEISLSVRILNALSRTVAIDFSLACSKNAYMLRESRQHNSRSVPRSDVGRGKYE